MVYDAGNEQCCRGVEGTDFCRPFHRVCFACRCGECADTLHDQSDTFVLWGEGTAEDAVYDPHHQKHEQEN